jgi:two-component system response regulator YesN
VIRREKPDLVITDIRMEPMDGLEMLETLLIKEKLQFEAIVISAHADFTFAKQCIKLGVNEYIIKPPDVEEFLNVVNRVIEKIGLTRLSRTPQDIPEMFNAILTGLLLGRRTYDNKLEKFITKECKMNSHSEIALVNIYLSNYSSDAKIAEDKISSALIKGGFIDFQTVYLPDKKCLIFIIMGTIINIEEY